MFEAHHRRDGATDAMLYAFDLLELGGKDLRKNNALQPGWLKWTSARLQRVCRRVLHSAPFAYHSGSTRDLMPYPTIGWGEL